VRKSNSFFFIQFYMTDESSHRLIEKGGDWDRRNRLKVYRGLHLISIRQFAKGGELLLDRSVLSSPRYGRVLMHH
jgi:hypothetical protein